MPARTATLALLADRVVGMALFEMTETRWDLVISPNQVRNRSLAFLIVRRFFPHHQPKTWWAIGIWLALLCIPKLEQEYVLHSAEAQPWDRVERNRLVG